MGLRPTPANLHRLSNYLYRAGLVLPARLVQWLIFFVFSAVLPAEVRIGEGTIYAHGALGVVLNPKATIGKRVFIGHEVTIGGRSRQQRYPVVEDDVYIGAGAKVLGDLTIGHNSTIGANAVVVASIPARSVALGIPARVVQNDIDARDLEEW